MPHPLTAITSPCPYYLGGRKTRRPVRLSFGSYLLVYALKSTHIVSGTNTSCLPYFRPVLSLFPKYDLTAFVALHQDVWSRYACKSSAIAWTLEQVGFNLSALLLSPRSPTSALCG